jgi:hypothetical protein
MPNLFGRDAVRFLAWVMVLPSAVGFFVGAALLALTLSPKFLSAIDSSLLVFSRGVIAVIGLTTFMGSLFGLTIAAAVLSESRFVEGVAALASFSLLPALTALSFTAELVYAATLYRRIHQRRGDGLSRALSVGSVVLAVPCGVAAVGSGLLGLGLFLDTLRLAKGTSTLLWGLVGGGVSALLGLGGFGLALSGAIRSTSAVLGRGAVMLLGVGIFFVSSVFVAMGLEDLSRSSGAGATRGAAPALGVVLAAFVALLFAAEFALGAALHFQVAARERTALGRWLGGGSVVVSCLFGAGSLLLFGLGLLMGLAPA